ncbi:thyroglobulin [Genypterus blacodes]|uniref:thyroglobulin n=1 Tax=Genypterus blacodes TaxID=154954 RepID=UPI003F772A2F
MYLPSCTPGGGFREVQCRDDECWCVDSLGQEVIGSRTRGPRRRCPSVCERERDTALKRKAKMAASAEIHIPECSEAGDFLPLQCVGAHCFCVNAEGKQTPAGSAGGAVTCAMPTAERRQSADEVTEFRQEVERIISGFSLTGRLRLSQSEEELRLTDRLLMGSDAALRLALHSTLQANSQTQQRSYQQPYTPQCDAQGGWLLTQCHLSTGQCWCVDEVGMYIPGSLTSRSLRVTKCLSLCQRSGLDALLSGWLRRSGAPSGVLASYRPQCEEDGSFSVLQTGGALSWCVHPQTGQSVQSAAANSTGQPTCRSLCELQGRRCRPDGSFAPLQCDVTSCWCASEAGQEVMGTRAPRQAGSALTCDRPLCPAPSITHGALLCRSAAGGHQICELVCHHGYHNALPVSSFLCEADSRQWEGNNKPLGGACQASGPLQSVSLSQLWSLSSSCSHLVGLQTVMFSSMTSRGLCSVQLPLSGRSVSLCDDSSVRLQCDGQVVMVTLRWTASVSHFPASELPDLQDIASYLNASRLLDGVRELLDQIVLGSEPKLVSMTTPSFSCLPGYQLDGAGEGCIICPAGTFSSEGACLLCPQGTYQDEEGRDSCNKCPTGSSHIGSSSVDQCVTECQRRGLRCSEGGDFLLAQPDILSGRWRCVSSEGAELEWTASNMTLTDEECSVLSRFQAASPSELLVGAKDTEVLQMMTSDLSACVKACAVEPSCLHVALYTEDKHTKCELYSTHTLNTHCNTSQKASGFLGNPQAEVFDWLSCSLRLRGGASDLLVIRKKGTQSFVKMRMMKVVSEVFRTLVFREASLTDAHRFCLEGCSQNSCCDGFILNRNDLDGGTLLCGLLRNPSVLMCGDQDWDMIGQGKANRICGGQKFNITDSSLPADSENMEESIISFQAVYLKTGSAPAPVSAAASCPPAEPGAPLDASVQLKFEALSEDDVLVDPQRKLPALNFWLNKKNYNSQNALLWCLTRCEAELQCSLADLRDGDSEGFFSCVLMSDSRVCGAYDKPLRKPCRPLLDTRPNNTYMKKTDLSGPVKSFYDRISFQKMVAYSVRSRISLSENTPLSEGFMACERRCDEDPCCRGIGFVRDTKSSGAGVVCLALISLGVQTCGEGDRTNWRTQDCKPSTVQSSPEPFGWYQKPVHQWTPSPALCPPFSLPAPKLNTSLDSWARLADSAVSVDPSVTSYNVIHVSRDIASDRDETRDWCLHACQEAESCTSVSVSETESATRCILYPDTRACGLSSAPDSSNPTSSCKLLIREPAPQVYLRTVRLPLVTSVSIPGRGTLHGIATKTALGSDRTTVVQFLGVPYARPPIGSLRFAAAQPADWTGTWSATKPRPPCIQPGDLPTSGSSEDCLYLNVFSSASRVEPVPVLVFFFNPRANQDAGLLDGSTLAAMGNIVVVTASYRTAALGFLSTGSAGLHGNYGLSDQEAVLRWVHAHISLVGGDSSRVTVGAERRGADILSLHLLSSSSLPPLFQRMILMGGAVLSPALVQSVSSSRRQALNLAEELGCLTSDLTNDHASDISVATCLRETPVHTLNAAQTKLLAVSGPFQSWAPVAPVSPVALSSLHRVDLLLGSSQSDGLISRARHIKDFEALQGRAGGKEAFYQALSRSLGGVTGSGLLKEAAAWFYSLDHSPSPAGYNLFSRALDSATRDLFITCPSLWMASLWANNKANVFLYHQPESNANNRADVSIPLDVQFAFGTPHHPISIQRFSPSARRVSLALMTYMSSFIRSGNPNPSLVWEESVLPRWMPVRAAAAAPFYLQLSPALKQQRGLRQNACSFWKQLAPKLSDKMGADL